MTIIWELIECSKKQGYFPEFKMLGIKYFERKYLLFLIDLIEIADGDNLK